MNCLNYVFFDEFKALDNLCRDIYGDSVDKKLGVTMYLEDMDRKSYQGALKISGWTSDYNRLKSARKLRNDLAHSRNSFSENICSQEDIDFIRSFKSRILNQTDPIALLTRQTTQQRPTYITQTKQQPRPTYTYTTPTNTHTGCFGIVASFIIIVACIIALLL